MKSILEPVTVKHQRNRPYLIRWRGSLYEVRLILDWWVVQSNWWTSQEERRIHFRVAVRPLIISGGAQTGVLELYRSGNDWMLTRLID